MNNNLKNLKADLELALVLNKMVDELLTSADLEAFIDDITLMKDALHPISDGLMKHIGHLTIEINQQKEGK